MKQLLLFGLLSAWLMGCSAGKTAPVNGQVKLKGGGDVAVLAGYAVAFELEGAKTSGVGEIKPDGTFTISTFGTDDGAAVGKHRVSISPPLSPDPDKPTPKPKIAAKYASPDSSNLTVDIKPGRNDVVLEVEPAP